MIFKRDTIIEEHMGTIKGVVGAYTDGSDQDRWDDLFLAAMEGASYALSTFNQDRGEIKQHIRRGCRNYIIMELRRMQRWDKSIPFSKTEDIYEVTDEDDVTFETSVSDNTQGIGNSPLWVESKRNPEEEYLRQEALEIATRRVAKLILGFSFSERELYVLWNYIITDTPETLRDIASQFGVDKSSIHRDVTRINKQLRIEEDS